MNPAQPVTRARMVCQNAPGQMSSVPGCEATESGASDGHTPSRCDPRSGAPRFDRVTADRPPHGELVHRGEPLRVSCFIGSLKPNGAERVLVRVADWLSAQGAAVEIVTVEPPGATDLVPSRSVRHRVVSSVH